MKKVFVIGEIGQAHEGSLGILYSYIDALARVGVDAVKFQMHIAEAESSDKEPFRINFSYEDKTRYDYWKRMEFSEEQWRGIKAHCESLGMEFVCSPFSIQAVNILERLNVKTYKVASGEISNYLMLEKIAKTKKKILLSTGMSDFFEIDQAVAFIEEIHGNKEKISLFQCTTGYPTQPQEVGLNVIQEMVGRYKVPVGLSDHSGEIYAILGAVALGATICEAHVVFDKSMFGPDSTSSLNFSQFKQLVDGIRYLEKALNNPIDKHDSKKFKDLKKIFGKSLAVNKTLKKGEVITFDCLETKKPGGEGLDARMYKEIIGKKVNEDIPAGNFLKEGMLSE